MQSDVAPVAALLVLLAGLLAWPVTRLLLSRYRAAVRRTMQRAAGPPSVPRAVAGLGPPAAADQPVRGGAAALRVPPPPSGADASPGEGPGGRDATSVAAALLTTARRRQRRLQQRYDLGGLLAAGVLTAATLASIGSAPLPGRTAVTFLVLAWPVVLATHVVSGYRWRPLATRAAVYAVAVVGGGALWSADWYAGLVLWLWLNGVPTAAAVAFLRRTVRAAGPLVLAGMLVAVTGAVAPLLLVGGSDRDLQRLADVAVTLRLGAVEAVVLAAAVGLVIAGLVGWRLVRALGTAYRTRGLPDQLVQVTAVWTPFLAVHTVSLGLEGAGWMLAGPLALAVLWLVAARPGPATSAAAAPRLLLLRVFADDRRGEQLLRRLAATWEHLGPVRLIGGPDVALVTVEPDEFLDYVAGRLRERFVAAPADLSRQLHADPRDRHGRHRVQELLCFDDTWRPVVGHLVDESDVVVLDLRGFSAERAGVRVELDLLGRVGALPATVLVCDETSDLALAGDVLVRAGADPRAARTVQGSPDAPVSADEVVTAALQVATQRTGAPATA